MAQLLSKTVSGFAQAQSQSTIMRSVIDDDLQAMITWYGLLLSLSFVLYGAMHADMSLGKTDNLGYGAVKRRERNVEVLELRTSFRYATG